jgi:methyl-accepting chemotaxis protein/aerotaxis receptor
MADTVESKTTTALEGIGSCANTMAATAEEMGASAGRTGVAARGAADAAGQALTNAQMVAGAARKLSVSIGEITGQISQSAEVVRGAVSAGKATRKTIETLNQQIP